MDLNFIIFVEMLGVFLIFFLSLRLIGILDPREKLKKILTYEERSKLEADLKELNEMEKSVFIKELLNKKEEELRKKVADKVKEY